MKNNWSIDQYIDIHILYLKRSLYYNNYLEEMLKYKLENKLEENNPTIYCEICGKKQTLLPSINEYHKDGTIKMHYSCSNHIVALYNVIIKDIENK